MACLTEVKTWLSSNFLHFNESKTEMILIRPSDYSTTPKVPFDGLSSYVRPWVRNLGVVFDESLKFERQINSVVKSCFFQLRLLSKVKTFLSFKNFEKVLHAVLHAFIFSRLDYCNSLYAGTSHSAMSRLQLVQNAAARLLTGAKKRNHITPILRSLQWLPVRYRVEYKLLIFVYKSMNSLAPPYLSALLTEHLPSRSLRSSNQRLLSIPKSKLKSRGDRAFSVVGPRLWNDLPTSIRMASSLSVFKSKLKTLLLDKAFNT